MQNSGPFFFSKHENRPAIPLVDDLLDSCVPCRNQTDCGTLPRGGLSIHASPIKAFHRASQILSRTCDKKPSLSRWLIEV